MTMNRILCVLSLMMSMSSFADIHIVGTDPVLSARDAQLQSHYRPHPRINAQGYWSIQKAPHVTQSTRDLAIHHHMHHPRARRRHHHVAKSVARRRSMKAMIRPGSLRHNVARLVKQAGWDRLVWRSAKDYRFIGHETLQGKNLPTILAQLLQDYPLQALCYEKNHVVMVQARALTA